MSERQGTSFAPLPVGAISDSRLSGLDLRVLACLAFHDRMSLVRGKGQGCWASHETLAAEVGCHYTRLSSAITHLAKLGYVEREPHHLNKRLRVYRVRYDSLPNGKGLPAAPMETVGEAANNPDRTVCRPSQQAPETAIETGAEYISLSDERYLAEARKDTPLEEAALACGSATGVVNGIIANARLNDCARMAMIERRLRAGAIYEDEWEPLATWLTGLADASANDTDRGRAERLYEQVCESMTDDAYLAWLARAA